MDSGLITEDLLGFDWVMEPSTSQSQISCDICCDGLCCNSLKFSV
jgi:hypothetical protein